MEYISGEEQHINLDDQLAEVVMKGLESNHSMKLKTDLENQGVLERSGVGRGTVTLSFPDLDDVQTVVSTWQGIAQQIQVVSHIKQNTGIDLSLAQGVGEVVRQTAMPMTIAGLMMNTVDLASGFGNIK